MRTTALALLGLVLIFESCGRFESFEQVSATRSPDGLVDAVVMRSNPGATAEYSYSVFLASAGSDQAKWKGPVILLYAPIRNEHKYGVDLKWSADGRSLFVECLRAKDVKIRSQEERLAGRPVRIFFEPGVLLPDTTPQAQE